MIYRLSNEYFVRTLCEKDIEGPYRSWFEDQEVCRFNSHGKYAKTDAWLRRFIESIDDAEMVVWAICHETDGHIGNLSLQALSMINRSAEFAILLGDRRHWNRGVGRLASLQLFEHGFRKLNLNRIYCGTASTNKGMQNLAVSLGMQKEGLRRSHLYLEGSWVDVVEYGVLSTEFSMESGDKNR
ncbi:GNAT family N-acetyltransferase [Haliea sp. E1-2-M8]|uniref:GNAT family N-acetyltransferase n=1 Tax=Haliea sp. E1-2-M8 TaxID=3064706 RepID=UPI00271C000F|nr:GNAT family N-acetyltransferase [Haliea sp. E1-2-M8]MDO8861662.1 GNAT family N-acetyltransferase [Haliea sp. E1-2-M8]